MQAENLETIANMEESEHDTELGYSEQEKVSDQSSQNEELPLNIHGPDSWRCNPQLGPHNND